MNFYYINIKETKKIHKFKISHLANSAEFLTDFQDWSKSFKKYIFWYSANRHLLELRQHCFTLLGPDK